MHDVKKKDDIRKEKNERGGLIVCTRQHKGVHV